MKKTKKAEKLSFSAATIRRLAGAELVDVAGGLSEHATLCNCKASGTCYTVDTNTQAGCR